MFESRFTTRDDGTGYGLDIVREIAEVHGRTIVVSDAERLADATVNPPTPDGACFEIRAPSPEHADEPAVDANRTWIDPYRSP